MCVRVIFKLAMDKPLKLCTGPPYLAPRTYLFVNNYPVQVALLLCSNILGSLGTSGLKAKKGWKKSKQQGPSCKAVWQEECWDEPSTKCVDVPSTKCWDETKEECWDEPREECWDEPKQQCKKVPRQSCRSVPRQFQDFVTGQECKTVQKQECKQVTLHTEFYCFFKHFTYMRISNI